MIEARTRANLSQAQLAERMNTTQTAIARLESGNTMPSTRTLRKIAKATGHRLRIIFEPEGSRLRRPARLKLPRIRLGLTQEQFAKRYGIPITTLSDWEQGR